MDGKHRHPAEASPFHDVNPARRGVRAVGRRPQATDEPMDIETMRAMLTDATAIAAYKSDPFNPWAIARFRHTAFQKAIVMKYVGNLLDWGDSLLSQFTIESGSEALFLYIIASEMLGALPQELGDCGTGDMPITYGGGGARHGRHRRRCGRFSGPDRNADARHAPVGGNRADPHERHEPSVHLYDRLHHD